MDRSSLAPEKIAIFKAALAAELAACADPSAVVGLQRGGDRVVEGFGTSNNLAVDNRIFRLASLTKPVTGVAAMTLVEDGVFGLTNPVDKWLPELAEPHVLLQPNSPLDKTERAKRPITVHDLMTCQMGTGLQFESRESPIARAMEEAHVNVGARHPRQMDSDTWIAALGALPLIHHPGAAWMYDTSIDVLGVLLERASGMSLGALFAERIFGPLRMEDTSFWVPSSKLDRLGPCIGRGPLGKIELVDPAGTESRFAHPPGFESAAEGLISTVADYLTFATMMLNRGRLGATRVISEESYALMTRDHVCPAQKTVSRFWPGFWESHGWGYCVAIQHGTSPSDPKGIGWIGGFGTACTWDHESGLISLLASQQRFDEATFSLLKAFWRESRALAT
ncbi:MAG: serine hydrolase domain-containing protein [Pseudomonadota bacterium]